MAAQNRLCFNAAVIIRRVARNILVLVSSAGVAAALHACGKPVQVDVDNSGNNLLEAEGGSFTDEDGAATITGACLTETTAAERRRVALYVMLDSSASMEEPVGNSDGSGTGGTKWEAVQRAIRSFMIETLDTDLSMGLQFFPLAKPGSSFICDSHADCGRDGGPCFLTTCLLGDTITLCTRNSDCPGVGNECVEFGLCANSDPAAPIACVIGGGVCGDGLGRCEDFERTCTNATDCNSDRYASPAVEIGLVSDNFDDVDRALAMQPPEGLTPTTPALQGAIAHAREWAATHPDHTVVTVLATDGLPTECGPEPGQIPPLDQVLTVAAEGLEGENPIRTFVIGVFQPGDGVSINNVNAIARAGGTDEAVFIDTSGAVEDQFLEALRSIRNGQLACQLQLPESGELLDYFRVNLEFDNGETKTQLGFVRDEAGCAASPNSWHYDVDANVTRPSAIEVCPAVCEQFRNAPRGSINLQLGCATILR